LADIHLWNQIFFAKENFMRIVLSPEVEQLIDKARPNAMNNRLLSLWQEAQREMQEREEKRRVAEAEKLAAEKAGAEQAQKERAERARYAYD
jgi:hypothetical protein